MKNGTWRGILMATVCGMFGSQILACEDIDDDGDDTIIDTDGNILGDAEVPQEGVDACEGYCMALLSCDDETDVGGCTDDCIETLSSCFEDTQADAIAAFEACAGASCGDVVACSFEAGGECFFGI